VRQSLAVLVSAVWISNSVPVGFESYRYYDTTAMYKPDCKSAQVFKVSREYLSWLIICQSAIGL